MANFFDVNRQVATSFVRAEQMKGWFLANAKLLLILLSGAMMFCGVTLLAWGNAPFTWAQVIAVAPMAFVAALLSVCIEGGTIFSSAMYHEVKRKIAQETKLLDRVKTVLGSAEYAKRKHDVEKQIRVPVGLMIICAGFSVTGAEIFWQKLFIDSAWYFHVIGALLGVVCSSLLIILELNADLVERIIESCIKSSGLIQIALEQSAKSRIYDTLFAIRQEKLETPEFRTVLEQAAQQGLYGTVSETIELSGTTVSASQLQQLVTDEIESRQAAETFIASGGAVVIEESPSQPLRLDKVRRNPNRDAVAKLVKEIGHKRILADTQAHAQKLGMDTRTLEKHLAAILAEKKHA